MKPEQLIARAQRKAKQLKKLYADERFLKTIGKLKGDGFLDAPGIATFHGMVFLKDALWAAELEPRIFELLPAIINRRPKYFTYLDLPKDLETVVNELRAGRPMTPYRGIEPEKYQRWTSLVGRQGVLPKVMRSFRLDQGDVALLELMREKTGKSFSKILSEALRAYVG
jgi:hypothetical protein